MFALVTFYYAFEFQPLKKIFWSHISTSICTIKCYNIILFKNFQLSAIVRDKLLSEGIEIIKLGKIWHHVQRVIVLHNGYMIMSKVINYGK